MYGLLLENLAEYIKINYGEDKWDDIRRQAGVDSPSFSVHQVYPETLLNKLAKKAQQVLGVSEREFMDQMGVCFVSFVSQYGYDRVLSVLGRHMRDFLNGLDNLHEYLKFSYPRMKAPSFICENETKQGLTLHYRSKRRGFVYYTMGQIREVARHFYHKEMHIELVREEILFDTVHVTFQLTFDNRAFTLASMAMIREEKHLPISATVLFEIFPFSLVFGSDMVVRSIGNSLMVVLPELIGKKITNWFDLVRPLIAFKFQTILNRTNNIFELVTVEPVPEQHDNSKANELLMSSDLNGENAEEERNLRLKGQMIYMDNWKMIMFLGTPVMPDLTSLINTGLYINDLSMHDFSRDLMLAGTQQSVELKLALDQEQQKSKKLEESMRKLDEEMRRTDELLYQMIPKQVADRLRCGENPIDTCEMFDSVSILFSDVVTFTEICSRITPMEVVSMLNGMYSIFDTLTERNNVYKVETIGDAYMVVSGAPEKDINHAEKVCDMALDMVEAITDLKDPSTGTHLRIRVGVHSGAVVAGIVGLKMPRYCLFGDTVNTASRMESTSSAMKIHISQTTKDLIGPNYRLSDRGEIDVKGKGTMKTFWLDEREHRKRLIIPKPLSNIGGTINVANFGRDITMSASGGIAIGGGGSSGSGSGSGSAGGGGGCGGAGTSGTIIRKTISNRRNSLISSPSVSADISRRKSIGISGAGGLIKTEDRTQLYSPITFQDVALRSIANSPVKTLFNSHRGRDSRSNSIGHVYGHSLSDVFGSLIMETEDFLEDINNRRDSQMPPMTAGSTAGKSEVYTSTASGTSSPLFSPSPSNRSATLSNRSKFNEYTDQELSFLEQRIPSPCETEDKRKLPNFEYDDMITNEKTVTETTITDDNNNNNNNSKTLEFGKDTVKKFSLLSLSSNSKKAQQKLANAKQKRALEKLDKMMEEIFENEGMCPFNFLPPALPDSHHQCRNMNAASLTQSSLIPLASTSFVGAQQSQPQPQPPPPPTSIQSTNITPLSESMHSQHQPLSISQSNKTKQPKQSKSDGNIANNLNKIVAKQSNSKLSNSQSFSHQSTSNNINSNKDHQCCTGINHHRHHHNHHHHNGGGGGGGGGRQSHSRHTHACDIL